MLFLPRPPPAGVLGGNPGKADLALPSVLFPGPATLGPDTQPTPLKGREFVGTPPSLGPTMGPCMSPRSPWVWVFAPQAPPSTAPTIINGQHPSQTRCQHRRLFRKRKKGSAAGCVRGNLGGWDGGGWGSLAPGWGEDPDSQSRSPRRRGAPDRLRDLHPPSKARARALQSSH